MGLVNAFANDSAHSIFVEHAAIAAGAKDHVQLE